MELKSKCLSFFHLNINLLSKNFDNFNHLINELKLQFDILGISESRILKSQSLNTNFSLQNYVIEQTPTESTAGGALLYINERHSYKTPPTLPFISQKNLNQSNLLQPQILLPTRISNNSKTLIDNISCNIPNTLVKSAVSGNISSSISDHLPQFLILPEFFSKSPPTKYNISHDW